MFGLPWHIVLPSLLGSLLAGLVCGAIGTFVVRMKLSSLGFAMSHAAFAGAALGMMLSLEPLWTAIAFSLLIALVLGPLADAARMNTDAALGALFPVTMALGFVFLTRAPGGGIGSGALSLLWGSVLGMTMHQVGLLAIVAALVGIVSLGFGRGFLALLLDRRLAIASGLNARAYYYGVLVLVAIVVSVSLRITGGLLIYALMVLPATSAFQWAYDIKKIFAIAPLLGALSAFFGFLFSLWADLPIGSAIAIVAAGIFLVSTGLSPKRRRERSG